MNLFQRKDCMLPVYTLAAFSKFQQEALDWDPIVLRDAFQAQFSCRLSQKAFDKLMAGTSMIGTNLFTNSIEGFLSCACSCADKIIRPKALPYVSLQECCWAVFVYKDMLGQDDQTQTTAFDPDIIAYIQALMDKQGIYMLPSYMQFAAFPQAKTTRIQQALVGDVQAFQAHTARQLNEMQSINAYVKEKQAALISQLKQLKPILNT